MSDQEFDILQIIKYHAGELDAKAMHQLELRAQHDPFLMEAMEGYESMAASHDSHLADIKQRLNNRINKKEGRVIPWRMLSIAASFVLLVSVIGVLWFKSNNNQEKRLASNITTPEKPKAAASKPEAVEKVAIEKNNAEPAPAKLDTSGFFPDKETGNNASEADNVVPSSKKKKGKFKDANIASLANAPVAAPDNIVAFNPPVVPVTKEDAKKDTTPLNEMIVMEMAAHKDNKQEAVAKVALPKKQPAPVMNQLLTSKVDGVTKTPSNEYGYIAPDLQANNALIKGKVVGKDGGFPVVGAIVKIAGTSNETVTDDKGSFTLRANLAKDKIVVGYAGYETKQLNVANQDSLKKIVLNPVNNALDEMIVADYNKKVNEGDTILKRAHPKNGWGNYRRYLKTSEEFTVGAAGLVKISFEVNHEGAISNINIVEGLTDLANKKALELIANGPAWIGNTAGAPEKVTFKIKFLK